MADDINTELRAELEAAKAVLAPQLRGLHDIAAFTGGDDLGRAIVGQIEARQRRTDLIQNLVDALNAAVDHRARLEADGYPALPARPLDQAEYVELLGEAADLKAALDVFTGNEAVQITIGLGAPADKPKGE